MELRELISFYHVAHQRSVSKAARTLELGQPTVTTHLRKLEAEFGVTLFDRIKRPIQLTSEGVILLELVTPVVVAVDALKTQMNYSEQRGSFVVGAYPDLIMHHLPRAIQAFRSQFPDVRIRLISRSYFPLMQLVKSGEIDLAISSPPPPEDPSIEFEPLFHYNVVLMTPPGHPLLDKATVGFQDIAAWPMILTGPGSLLRSKVDQALRDHGINCDMILSMEEIDSIKRYVEIGMGVAVCNDFSLHPEDHDRLGVVRLDHIFGGSDVGVCTLRGKFKGQAVRNFIETMANQLKGFHAELWESNWPQETAATPATAGPTDR